MRAPHAPQKATEFTRQILPNNNLALFENGHGLVRIVFHYRLALFFSKVVGTERLETSVAPLAVVFLQDCNARIVSWRNFAVCNIEVKRKHGRNQRNAISNGPLLIQCSPEEAKTIREQNGQTFAHTPKLAP